MNKATWAMLNENEKALLRQAEASALARLDEDDLIDLHTRARRARGKYTALYRRRAHKGATRRRTAIGKRASASARAKPSRRSGARRALTASSDRMIGRADADAR